MAYTITRTADIAFNFETARRILRYRRAWHSDLQHRFSLHPIVKTIIFTHNVRPLDWQQLLLEWPHVSVDDAEMIAYTRNEQDAQRDRQIRTTIGKYLARHWPMVPDHVRRDWAGSFGKYGYAIWETIEEIIAGVELGPQSCMKSSYGSIPFNSDANEELLAWFRAGKPVDNEVPWEDHPYCVYEPALGWRMAVRYSIDRPDVVLGRCLVNNKNHNFVRSYKRHEEDNGYSHTDERLEAWLREQGYTKANDWNGCEIRHIEHPDEGVMAPYIDGNTRYLQESPNGWRISPSGAYLCDNTDGTATPQDDPEPEHYCDDCGAAIYEDDNRLLAGRHEDHVACECCAEDYVEVRAPHGFRVGATRHYYLHVDNTIEVEGDHYDPENLHDDVVCCEDGEYRLRDDCVMCADGEYRLADDCVECADGEWRETSDCVRCADDKCRPKDECWESAEGNWYSNDEPQVAVGNGQYHPDELREMADNA